MLNNRYSAGVCPPSSCVLGFCLRDMSLFCSYLLLLSPLFLTSSLFYKITCHFKRIRCRGLFYVYLGFGTSSSRCKRSILKSVGPRITRLYFLDSKTFFSGYLQNVLKMGTTTRGGVNVYRFPTLLFLVKQQFPIYRRPGSYKNGNNHPLLPYS